MGRSPADEAVLAALLEVQPDDRQMRETMFESAREIGDEPG